MDHEKTTALLHEVLVGNLPLLTLIGKSFEGSFGDYQLAGQITSLRKQGDMILINWVAGNPHLVFRQDGLCDGVSFVIFDKAYFSRDFTLS